MLIGNFSFDVHFFVSPLRGFGGSKGLGLLPIFHCYAVGFLVGVNLEC